jgi:hypothetical protein
VAALGLLASCGTREDNSLGTSYIADQADLKAVLDTTLAPPDTSADFQLASAASGIGGAGTILVGERVSFGLRARGLVLFDPAAFPGPGTVLTEARLSFFYLEGLREANPPFSIAVHRVTSGWTERGLDTLRVFPTFDPTAAGILDLTPALGDTTPEKANTLSVSVLDLAQSWVEGPDSANVGLALLPTGGVASIVEFVSRESTSRTPAELFLKWARADSVTLPATADTFLLEKTKAFLPLDNEPRRITVSRGFPTRSLLKFELPDFGDRATINRAELLLRFDPALSDYGDFTLRVARLEGAAWTDSIPPLSSAVGEATAPADRDSVAIPVTELVAELLHEENHGFLVRATDERPDVDVLRIHGHDSEVEEARPRLRVWYTLGDVLEGTP